MTDEVTEETPADTQENAPDRSLSWDDIPLSAELRAGVDGKGYTNPTAVQDEAILSYSRSCECRQRCPSDAHAPALHALSIVSRYFCLCLFETVFSEGF